MKTLFSQVEYLRKLKGVTFIHLANQLKITPAGLRRALERNTLQAKYIPLLCSALDCSIIDLYPQYASPPTASKYYNSDIEEMASAANENIIEIKQGVEEYRTNYTKSFKDILAQIAENEKAIKNLEKDLKSLVNIYGVKKGAK